MLEKGTLEGVGGGLLLELEELFVKGLQRIGVLPVTTPGPLVLLEGTDVLAPGSTLPRAAIPHTSLLHQPVQSFINLLYRLFDLDLFRVYHLLFIALPQCVW